MIVELPALRNEIGVRADSAQRMVTLCTLPIFRHSGPRAGIHV